MEGIFPELTAMTIIEYQKVGARREKEDTVTNVDEGTDNDGKEKEGR